ncbi:MAG: S-methyl-5-thioribose-1-phosphate isomerase [candidate division WOR-3 bacterium]
MKGVGKDLPSFLFRPVSYRQPFLTVLDQTRLPARIRFVRLRSAEEVAEAIRRLKVRGAPWIGVAAGYGLAVEAWRLTDRQLRTGMKRAARMLLASRPTAVNLAWAVERVMQRLKGTCLSPEALRLSVEKEARKIEQEEIERSIAMARQGARLVPKGATILTICNSGALAGPGMGTALGVIFQAHLEGKRPRVFVCETRPLFQGARLTTLELLRARIPCTLIPDSAAASVIEKCDLVLVGADRIARNGDTANKVGTKMLALLAKEAGRPFYVVAPSSSFDPRARTGADIEIEERPADEVIRCGRSRVAPDKVRVFNPAFDITPAQLITAFITDKGVVKRL